MGSPTGRAAEAGAANLADRASRHEMEVWMTPPRLHKGGVDEVPREGRAPSRIPLGVELAYPPW